MIMNQYHSNIIPIPTSTNKNCYLLMMTTLLLNKLQPTINTTDRFSPLISHLNILNRMPQGSSSTIAYGHIALHFDGWDFVD
jgi:hypothetical protein